MAGGKYAVGEPLQDNLTEGKSMLKALLPQGDVSKQKLKLKMLLLQGEKG
jgi:hypothetical protein